MLHIFVQGRGGRMVAWGDQSANSEKCQETELMVDGGSEAIALKAKSLFMLGRWKKWCVMHKLVQALSYILLLHISQAWRGSGILS